LERATIHSALQWIKVFWFFFSKKNLFLVLESLFMPLLLLCLLFLWSTPSHAQILATIRAEHHLACGTVTGADDWRAGEDHGDLSPLGEQICRAVSVAILGDEKGLQIQEFPAELEAEQALKSGTVQLVVGVSPSVVSAMQFGLRFGPVVFYDSQRILVSKRSGITQLTDLKDQLICALDMSQPERTLREVMTARGIPYALATHSEQGEMDAAIAVRRCAAGTGEESRLAESRANFHAYTRDFVFLPDRLTLDPVVAASPAADPPFGLVVDWTIHALIEAEALGITQDNLATKGAVDDTRTNELMGRDFATAQALGLAHDWAAKVIATTGNYGEIFDRTLGQPYRLDRGLNALWTQGGLMRPMPMR
jgi:general L-amino acid transport system substrate-binding protein